jgi:hypothetical protein
VTPLSRSTLGIGPRSDTVSITSPPAHLYDLRTARMVSPSERIPVFTQQERIGSGAYNVPKHRRRPSPNPAVYRVPDRRERAHDVVLSSRTERQ